MNNLFNFEGLDENSFREFLDVQVYKDPFNQTNEDKYWAAYDLLMRLTDFAKTELMHPSEFTENPLEELIQLEEEIETLLVYRHLSATNYALTEQAA